MTDLDSTDKKLFCCHSILKIWFCAKAAPRETRCKKKTISFRKVRFMNRRRQIWLISEREWTCWKCGVCIIPSGCVNSYLYRPRADVTFFFSFFFMTIGDCIISSTELLRLSLLVSSWSPPVSVLIFFYFLLQGFWFSIRFLFKCAI